MNSEKIFSRQYGKRLVVSGGDILFIFFSTPKSYLHTRASYNNARKRTRNGKAFSGLREKRNKKKKKGQLFYRHDGITVKAKPGPRWYIHR